MSLPVILTSEGAVPTPPDTLRSTLVSDVAAQVPGYTADLPGALIEDIASTDVGAMAMIDQARVDLINSITPYGANAYLLNQMGVLFGLQQGTSTNTSAYVQFSGPAGYVIPKGWIVGDGTYQYAVQDGIIIESSGTSTLVQVIALDSGSWVPAANSITQMISTLPVGVTVTVTNPQAGLAGTGDEGTDAYRSRILQAWQAVAQGVADFLYTRLSNIANVTPRLVNIRQVSNGWEVICGGGDTYAVGYAIYSSVIDLSTIVGSTTGSRNISVTVTEGSNAYDVIYVNPFSQSVDITASWNTTLPNFTQVSQVNAAGQTAITNYVNSITVGQPINLLEMDDLFATAVSTILDPRYLTTLEYTVKIDGVTASPTAATRIISSDPEGYFSAGVISVVQA